MRKVLCLVLLVGLLAVPFTATAGDSRNKQYARIYDSNGKFSIEVKAFSGIVRNDAKVVMRLKVNEKNSWYSASIALDGRCDFGARNCSHWMKYGTAVDAAQGDGWSKQTLYGNELLTSSRPSEEPWGVVVIEIGDYHYILGYKIHYGKNKPGKGEMYIEFMKVSDTRSRLSWRNKDIYTGE
jgi:hypothetical protein